MLNDKNANMRLKYIRNKRSSLLSRILKLLNHCRENERESCEIYSLGVKDKESIDIVVEESKTKDREKGNRKERKEKTKTSRRKKGIK